MSKLYLIRHGLTEWNKLNKFQGSSDITLCEEGIEQAQKLSQRLKKYKIDHIYASDLSRAYETALYVAEPHHLAVHKMPEFREIHFGEWEGLTREEIMQLKEYDFNAWKVSPHTERFPGEGSFLNVQKRLMVGINRVIEENAGKDVAIVSHGASLKILILSLLGLDLSCYLNFWLGNTSLSIVEIRQDRNTLSLLNDMSHLEQNENTSF